MNHILRSLHVRSLVSTFLILLAGKALALDGSLSAQTGYVRAMPSEGQKLAATAGINCYLYFDLNLDPSFALGVSTGYTDLESGSQRLYLDGTLLNARWSPWFRSSWSPYLTVGAGFRPLSEIDNNHSWWPGSFQSQAGIGIKHPIFLGMDLDVTAFYDLNSPVGNSLSSGGIRAGFAFPIDFSSKDRHIAAKPDKDEWAKNIKKIE